MNTQSNNLVPWKLYLTTTAETLLAFYLATFCVAVFFTHQGIQSIISSMLLIVLYAFVIFACGKRIIEKLPLPALMIIIPIAPLLVIIIVISLIPILEKL